jgi:phytoene dehydrogenase-like protein
VRPDAIIVGAGPNGLAAAIELARHGISVLVREGADDVGGSARTEELTLPGFLHDVGSAVYPLGIGSPFFSSLPLKQHGLDWIHPEIPLAHPLDGEEVVLLRQSLDDTVEGLGADGQAYRQLVQPFVRAWLPFVEAITGSPLRVPRDPLLMARFGLRAVRSTTSVASGFKTRGARALLAGNAAHSALPLDRAPSAAVGLSLMVAAHAVGWPFPQGGAGALTRALASYLESLGGRVETGSPVTDIAELDDARAVLLDLTPRQVVNLVGDRLPADYRGKLARWQYGPGVFKLDWALDAPIPWAAEACTRAGTVHLGGTLEEITRSEQAPWSGGLVADPFVLLAQPSVFDPTRAPEGKHTAWAYCHVPNGWDGDATEAIESQVERFAPGFRDHIVGRSARSPAAMQRWNPNLVGGDFNAGALTLRQTLARPVLSRSPWGTPLDRLYVCSASTPPGGGVHGMCGFHAARAALTRSFRAAPGRESR